VEENELKSAIEAILFASGEPVSVARIALVLDETEEHVLAAAEQMKAEYETARRGIRLVRLNGSLQLHSAPEYAQAITRALEQRRTPKLTQASLEVLSIVAYFQPVTRAYIEQMRGADSSYTVGVLTERGLIEPCGQLDVVGRPTIFRTTDLFLRSMGISSVDELPPLPEKNSGDAVEQLQKKVDELRAVEQVQPDIPEETPA
jgi:segregation and condensation protein B